MLSGVDAQWLKNVHLACLILLFCVLASAAVAII